MGDGGGVYERGWLDEVTKLCEGEGEPRREEGDVPLSSTE